VNHPRLTPVPGTPIGYLASGQPVYPFAGASPDDDTLEVGPDDEPDDVEDELEEDDPSDDEREYRPPSRAEWVKVQASLVKANGSAKQRREAMAALQKQVDELLAEKAERETDEERRALAKGAVKPGDKKKAAGGGAAPVLPDGVFTKTQVRQQLAAATKEAEERVEGKYRDIAVKSAARAALSEAGVQGGGVSRLVKLLDLHAVELDEDGDVSAGLDEQIEELKQEFPQLFKEPEPVRPVRRRAAAPRGANGAGREALPEDTVRLSTAEKIARQALGSR